MRGQLWCIIVIVLLELCFWSSDSQNLKCHPRDLEALRGFIAELTPKPDGWGGNSSANCCSWVGITCNYSASLGLNDPNNTARVTKLELGNRRLLGRLSALLGGLDRIKVLNLSGNFIKDSIPPVILNLFSLETLDLSSNNLHGRIPESINLRSLQSLDLSSNRLNGSLPVHLCWNSSKLRVVNLATNYFSGAFPSGFGKCVLLEHLSLGTNNLTGNIAEDLFQLQRLNLLDVQGNSLSGTLSTAVGNLSSLVRLDISSNRFYGELPDAFGRLSKLQFLIAQSNEFTGGIPRSLSNSRALSLLNLRNNSLSGPLRLNCTVMANLTSLELGSNHLNGSLPENLSSCRLLRNVNLGRNYFCGQLPESFKNFHSLSYLSLSNCSLLVNISSTLQILQQCKNLTTLILTKSFRAEALLDDPSLRFEKLKVLAVANSWLTGSVPSWLSKSTDLQVLDLSFNSLTGGIPAWIGNLTDLFYLDLSNNSLTGEIPKSLTRLPSLINRNISVNNSSMDSPLFMKRDESSRSLQYKHVFWFPPSLIISHNNLTGPIWKEFGNLKKLHVFDMSMNKLSGSIPSSLSRMTNLEVLGLSYNKLTGSIPPSLQHLSFLSKFSVAYNNLSGSIPSVGQFQTFPSSSFEGNNLCGALWFPCQVDTPDGLPRTSAGRLRTKDIALGAAIGFPFGVGFYCLFLRRFI